MPHIHYWYDFLLIFNVSKFLLNGWCNKMAIFIKRCLHDSKHLSQLTNRIVMPVPQTRQYPAGSCILDDFLGCFSIFFPICCGGEGTGAIMCPVSYDQVTRGVWRSLEAAALELGVEDGLGSEWPECWRLLTFNEEVCRIPKEPAQKGALHRQDSHVSSANPRLLLKNRYTVRSALGSMFSSTRACRSILPIPVIYGGSLSLTVPFVLWKVLPLWAWFSIWSAPEQAIPSLLYWGNGLTFTPSITLHPSLLS